MSFPADWRMHLEPISGPGPAPIGRQVFQRIILESSNARACAGLTDRGIGDRLHAMAVALFARGRRLAQV